MICSAIGRMIASSFHWMRGICFGWIFPPWALLFGFLGLAPQGLASSSVVHRLCTIWMHARSRTLIPSVLFGAGISTVSSLENFHVMMRSRVALLMLSRDAQPIRSLRACASDWTYDLLVLWIKSWNWLSTFSKWDLVEIEISCTWRCCIQFSWFFTALLIFSFLPVCEYLHVFEGPAVQLSLVGCLSLNAKSGS